MNVYIVNFGRENSYWSECLRRKSVAIFNDEDLHQYWEAGDRDGWIARCIESKKTASGIKPTRPIASRWFNLMGIVNSSVGDIWIHRQKSEVWWTTTTTAPPVIELIEAFEPNNDGTRHYVSNKPAEAWSNRAPTGAPLLWDALHPRAREFLFTEGTLQQLAADNADYAQALIAGKDLSAWHQRTLWKDKVENSRRAPAVTFTAQQRSVFRMVKTVGGTVANARGQVVERVAKLKEQRMSDLQLERYLEALLAAQNDLCAITGLKLQFDGEQEDDELSCSLDRIDSAGHYEVGNLQIVCKFVNRWKGASDDEQFCRLIRLVRTSA